MDAEADGSLSVQSAFLSFPTMAQFGPKSGELIDSVFKRKYQSIMKATIPDNEGRNIWFPNWKPFIVYCPSDQKFSWLACTAGGAAKVKIFFVSTALPQAVISIKLTKNFVSIAQNCLKSIDNFLFLMSNGSVYITSLLPMQ